MAKTYSEKLKDPRWQKKRLEILNRDNFTCRSCKSKEKTLHVHHFRYSGEPWEADNKMLITLCEDCHNDFPAEWNALISDLETMFIQYRWAPDNIRMLCQILVHGDGNLKEILRAVSVIITDEEEFKKALKKSHDLYFPS